MIKKFRKESCVQEHCLGIFNSMRDDVFLRKVIITLLNKTNGEEPKKR